MAFVRGLSVSSCGDKVWACQIQKKVKNNKYISRLMMYDFKKKSYFLYDYEHQDLILSVLVSETFKLAMSGGSDKTLMLHGLESGKTIKRFDMKYGSITCLFDLGTAVAVADEHTVRLLDIETRKMGQFEVKAEGMYINCMNQSFGRIDQNDKMALLVGGALANKIDKINIPKAIKENERDILEIWDETKNMEKFSDKMINLQNENKQLREKNQKLKEKLKQEKKEKINDIVKYRKKFIELSNEVKKKEKKNTTLQEYLQQAKNEITTLKSLITRTCAVKRNLIIQQILQKTRTPNPKDSNDALSRDSDDPFALNKQEMREKISTLQEKIRKQRHQIYDLENENDALQDKRDQNQRLLKNNEKLTERLETFKKTNKDVRAFW